MYPAAQRDTFHLWPRCDNIPVQKSAFGRSPSISSKRVSRECGHLPVGDYSSLW